MVSKMDGPGTKTGSAKKMIEIKGVCKDFNEKKVIRDISLTVQKGDHIAIVGPSGCGKSTLLRLIAGLLSPDCGSVYRTCKRLGFIFQDDRLIPWKTVRKNLQLIGAKDSEIDKILEKVGLDKEGDRLPSLLSGGMKQRVNIARGLLYHPQCLLLDEPFSNLDVKSRNRLMRLITKDWVSKENASILVTHQLREAIVFSQKIVFLSQPPSTILDTWDLNKQSGRFEWTLDQVLEIEKEIYHVHPSMF